ncbi:MAG: hypothetical protein JW829_14165 [Pirellulales bacterium]|nr:hypothetical protein [Pirellulales bacterium]
MSNQDTRGIQAWRPMAVLATCFLFSCIYSGCGDVQRRSVRPSMVGVVEDEMDLPKKTELAADESTDISDPAVQEEPREPTPARATKPDYEVSRATASDARAVNALRNEPLLVPLDSYFWAGSRIEFIKIEEALKLYQAFKGYYPKTHEEFMKEIIRENSIDLPELQNGWEYFYDATDHTLKKRRIR